MKNYITENSLCSIYGPSGSYKSFLAISWACHIATVSYTHLRAHETAANIVCRLLSSVKAGSVSAEE
ncbi:AAA family ATPase [Klebsiella quasipneumoniae subsp. similipneumoniae]